MAAILKLMLNAEFKLLRDDDNRYEWSIHAGANGYGRGWNYGHVLKEEADAERPYPLEPLAGASALPGISYWVHQMRIYSTSDDDLNQSDVHALLNETANRRRLTLEKAHALQAMTKELDKKAARAPIAQEVKIAVWQRDAGRCVGCESQTSLEFDHIIPVAMGGANTMRNLQLLCETCNRRKGATLG